MLSVRDVTRAYRRIGAILRDPETDWYKLMDAATMLLITSRVLEDALDEIGGVEGHGVGGETLELPLKRMNRALQWVMQSSQGAPPEVVRSKLDEAWRNAGTVFDSLTSPGSSASP